MFGTPGKKVPSHGQEVTVAADIVERRRAVTVDSGEVECDMTWHEISAMRESLLNGKVQMVPFEDTKMM